MRFDETGEGSLRSGNETIAHHNIKWALVDGVGLLRNWHIIVFRQKLS